MMLEMEGNEGQDTLLPNEGGRGDTLSKRGKPGSLELLRDNPLDGRVSGVNGVEGCQVR